MSGHEVWGNRSVIPGYRDPKKEDKKIEWSGRDTSLEIFPHLNLNWSDLKAIYEETGKPIADIGSSFSSLPTEGIFRGIEIIPIDRAYDQNALALYPQRVYEHAANDLRFKTLYLERRGLLHPVQQERLGLETNIDLQQLDEAVEQAQKKCVKADIASLPFADESLSLVIVHDSVPKHSADLNQFLKIQLPEILRVTHRMARIYPMAIFKEVIKKETHPYTGEKREREVLVESRALYKNPDTLKRISEVAKKFGFTFRLERGKMREELVPGNPFNIERSLKETEQLDSMLGVFTRIE